MSPIVHDLARSPRKWRRTAKSSWDTVLKNVALAILSLNAGGILGLVAWALAVISLAAALSVATFDAAKKRSSRLTPAARTP